MVTAAQQAKARTLRSLHEDGVLVLPNAWDAGSAAVIAGAGAPVVATTSAGMSWALGRPDGQQVSRAEMTAAIARIVAAVDVPVTADVEGGYGPTPADVAATVAAVIGAGAVGVNVEDSLAPGGPLHEPAAQVERIVAARQAATAAGLPELVINARTDVYLFGIGEPEGRLEDVLARAEAYAAAGADCLFVPGLLDLEVLAPLANKVSLPINAMVGPGAPSVAALQAAGVRRVSLGPAIALAAYGVAQRAVAEVFGAGTYDALADAAPWSALNDALPGR